MEIFLRILNTDRYRKHPLDLDSFYNKKYQNLPFARARASSRIFCFVCLTTFDSKRASSTNDRLRDG